jgi:organic hydroperoxide reductase OsmC/OhrA
VVFFLDCHVEEIGFVATLIQQSSGCVVQQGGDMMSQFPHFYETEVEWTGQKKGKLTSTGLPDLEVAIPPEFQGHEGIWSPEHYFLASVNGCFMTTFLAISQMSKLEYVSFSSKARGKLDKVEGQVPQITELVLRPRLIIRYARDLERAGRLLEKAEKNCYISNSIKTRVTLDPELLRAEE